MTGDKTGDKQNDATAEFNEALAAGFAAGNFDGVAPFYTEDATLMPPRGQFLEGRAAACAFWRSVANRFSGVVFTTVTTKTLGDGALREAGTYAMQTADGPGAQGKYVFVWQLVDGEWQIESGIWNRNAEAGGGRRQGQGQQGGVADGQGGGGQGGGRYRQGGGGQGGGGQGGRYRQGGAQGGGQGGGQTGGYRQGGGRPSFQGGGRPSFQGGGGGNGQRQGAGGRQGGGRRGGYGGGSLYDGNGGLYSNTQD